MTRRILFVVLLGLLALRLLACAGGAGRTTPATPSIDPGADPGLPTATPSGGTTLGAVYQSGDLQQAVGAIYTLAIDPATLVATTELQAARSGQANDDLYLLPLDNFFKPNTFRVTTVVATTDTIDVSYRIEHPFPAPANLDALPNASTNRADLGFAGMTLFLADAPAADNTYFADRILNTTLIANPDAYFSPAGMLTLSTTANTCPYRQLVDETVGGTGNRVGLSNGGSVTGNYGADGWSRVDMGANHNGWTGYGILHQGQSATNMVSINKSAVTTGFALDIALIVKYNDPRGGSNSAQKKGNRLPPVDPPNYQKLMYRMPHGALDVGRIVYTGQTGEFLPGDISAATLSFQIEDWDAEGTVTTSPSDLAADPIPYHVNTFEVGGPTVAVCIPGVTGSSSDTKPLNLVDGPETGAPGSGLAYSAVVTKSAIDSGAGVYTGLVQVIDVEDSQTSSPWLAVKADLTPANPAPRAITYQSFTTSISGAGNTAPNVVVMPPVGTVASGNGVLSLQVNYNSDPDGDPIHVRFDWNNDGNYLGTGEGYQLLDGTTPDTFASPLFYNNADLTDDTRYVGFQYSDFVMASPLGVNVEFTLGANQAPQAVSGNIALQSAALTDPGTFMLQNNSLSMSDPENDGITYTVRAVPATGLTQTQSSLALGSLNGYNATPVMGPWSIGNSAITIRVYANDANHTTTNGAVVPGSPLIGTIAAGCGLNGASSNTTLATLNPSGALRTASTAIQAIGGVRVAWSAVGGTAEYAVQRATWPVVPVTDPASLSFTTLGTTTPAVLNYNDMTVSSNGTRYIYRVVPRCIIGGTNDAVPTQLAAIFMQNFESTSATVNAMTTSAQGWSGVAESSTSTIATYNDGTSPSTAPLRGNRDLSIHEFFATGSNPGWSLYSTPQLNHRASLGTLNESRFEFNFSRLSATNNSRVAVASNASLPAVAANAGVGWNLISAITTSSFNEKTAGGLIDFTGLAPFGGIDVSWGNSDFGPSFVQLNSNTGTLTAAHNYVMIITGSNSGTSANPANNENAHVDDIAWIIY